MRSISTEREFVERVLGMIDATHWTTNALACPVYEVRRTPSGRVARERNPDYDPSNAEWLNECNVPKTRVAVLRNEDGEPVIVKWTYCLVGLLMKVAGMPDEEIEDESDLDVVPGKRAPLLRLAARVNDLIFDRLVYEGETLNGHDECQHLSERVCQVEIWNDRSSKEQVRDLLARVRDSLPEPA